MRTVIAPFASAGLLAAAAVAVGQPPGGPPRGSEARREAQGFVERMLAFDADADGRLSKAEVSDERLTRLFGRADADQDGTVTREELAALEASESETYSGGRAGGPGGPPDGFEPPGGGPPGGPPSGPDGPPGFGGPGGPMGRPRPGEVLPPPVRDELELTEDQRNEIDDLQKEVDARLEKILTEDQLRRLRQAQEFGPGGRPEGPGPRGRQGRGRPPGGSR